MKVNHIARKRYRVHLASLDFLLYLLPFSILLGTTFPTFSIDNRIVYIGTNEILIGILSIVTLLRILLINGKLPVSRKIFQLIVIFSSILLLSIFVTILKTQRIDHINSYIELARWIEYLLVFFIISTLIQTKNQAKGVVLVMFMCTIILIAVSVYQMITFDYNVSRIYGAFISGSVRAGQSISNPNVLGAFFMISSLYLIAFAMDKSLQFRKFRRILWSLVILNTIVLFHTLSRSAMLGFLLGLLVLSYIYRKPFIIVTIGSLTTLVLLLSESVQKRLIESLNPYSVSVTAKSISTRFAIWKTTSGELLNQPLLGVGFGAFQEHFGFLTPDNYYLEILATTGVLGLTTLMLLFWRITKEVSTLKNVNDNFFKVLGKSYIASIFAFLIANVFGGLFFNPRLLGLFWLLTGLTLKGKHIAQRKR